MAPAGTCTGPALGQGTTGFTRKAMLRTITVKRRDPPEPDGFAFQLEFRGTDKADFHVGGKLLDRTKLVEECYVGQLKAHSIVNQPDGEWYAVLKNVPPGVYVVTTRSGAIVTDQFRVRIAASK